MPKASEEIKVKVAPTAETKEEKNVMTETVPAEKAAEVKTEEKAEPEAVAEPTKAAEPKKEEAKAEVKAADTKKAMAKPGAKRGRKPAAAKAAETKEKPAVAEKAKPKENVYIQYANKEVDISEMLERAKGIYTGKPKSMKEIKVYVKPEENMAYVVVNGEEVGSIEV